MDAAAGSDHGYGDDRRRARPRGLLATEMALWAARGDRRRARLLAEQAREGYAAAGAVAHDKLAAVTRWLAAHRG